jgi:putative peptidoglycan lipid II flippase
MNSMATRRLRTISTQTWLSASVFLMGATILSKAGGIVREILIAKYFGATGAVDAFAVAYSIPLFVAGGIGFTISTAVVPQYHHLATSAGPARGSQFLLSANVSTCVCSALLLLPLCLAAPAAVQAVAPGLPPDTARLAAHLIQWLSLLMLVANLVYVLTAAFHALHHFKTPAYSDMAFNLLTVLLLVSFAGPLGIYALVVGNLVGISACAGILVSVLSRYIPYRLVGSALYQDARELLRWGLPILGYYLCSQIGGLLGNYFAATLHEGSVAALNYARSAIAAVMTLVTMNLSRGLFPTLALLSSDERHEERRDLVLTVGRFLIVLFVPVSAVFIVRAREIMEMLYMRGLFDDRALAWTSTVFVFLAATLAVASLEPVLVRASYALADMRTPLLSSLAGAVLLTGLLSILAPLLGIAGIGLATSLALVVQVGIQTYAASRRLGGSLIIGWSGTMMRSALCALLAAPVFLFVPAGPLAGLIAGALLYLGCYYAMAHYVMPDEFRLLRTTIRFRAPAVS